MVSFCFGKYDFGKEQSFCENLRALFQKASYFGILKKQFVRITFMPKNLPAVKKYIFYSTRSFILHKLGKPIFFSSLPSLKLLNNINF